MIADNYQCEISDITSNNLHITDYKNLKAGMKLKIPFLSKPVMETLEETESFISDYYPNLNTDFKKKEKVEVVEPVQIIDEEIACTIPAVEIEEENVKKPRETIDPTTYYSGYSGNIIPNIPEKYIRKI